MDIELHFGYELAVHATRRAKLKSDRNNQIQEERDVVAELTGYQQRYADLQRDNEGSMCSSPPILTVAYHFPLETQLFGSWKPTCKDKEDYGRLDYVLRAPMNIQDDTCVIKGVDIEKIC
ncbi:hypothetical protein CEP53_007779 [Fusarium sp. AF-6]|nr:hypothetical protein CEP53_007779 [Fusarium sp. AF-6]